MRAAIVAVSLIAAGCSSAPKVVAEKPQYCYTYQTIETENREQVNSRVRVECTDDQIERLTSKRLGMSPNCGEFSYWMQIDCVADSRLYFRYTHVFWYTYIHL